VGRQSNWNTNDPQYYGSCFRIRFGSACARAVTNFCTMDGGKTFTPLSGSCTSTIIIGFDVAVRYTSGRAMTAACTVGRQRRYVATLPDSAAQFYRITLDNAPLLQHLRRRTDNGSIGLHRAQRTRRHSRGDT
jgi:hypothetical protein